MLLPEHSSCLCRGENGKPFCLDELWPALIVWDVTINAVHAFQNTKKKLFWFHTRLLSSFPLHGRTKILLVNYDSCWQRQMSVRELRHGRPSGRFSESRGLSASVSFLSSPPLPALLLAPFFARSLTLVPHSLLLNRTETLATEANYFGTRFLSTEN